MTLPATTRRAGPFNGNGVTTAFPFTFKVFAASDIQVVKAVSGVETTLVLSSDYTVTLNGDQDANPGGTVTYASLASGQTLSIAGNLAYDQPLDLPSGGNFSPIALENELDRLTMQVQQVKETASRALVVPLTSTASSALPAPEANKLIAWNETASALQNLSASQIASVVAYGTANANIFTGDGTTKIFTLTVNPAALNNLDVAIGGVTQLPGVDYTWTSGTTVTFTTAPPFGAKVLIRYMQALALGTADAGSVQYTPAGTGAVATTAQAKLRESVSVKDFGAKGDGTTDDTVALQLALNSGKSLIVPAGTYLTGVLTPPPGNGLKIIGDGIGKTIFLEKAANQGIFTYPLGIQFGAYIGFFSLKCHASSSGVSNGLLASGYYNTVFTNIGYLSNGSGYWQSLINFTAYPQLSYGNTLQDVHIFEQVGPAVPVLFSNGGFGVNYNANACRVIGGIIGNCTKVTTCIDASRSINTVINKIWLESNSNKTTWTGLQADAASGISAGESTAITENYLEALSPYVDYPFPTGGGGNYGYVAGNTFSGTWNTTTTFYNGAKGNLWVGNSEGGAVVTFSGSTGLNWKLGYTATPTAPALSYSSGTTGTLGSATMTLIEKLSDGSVTYKLTTTWDPASSGANNATLFGVGTISGYEITSLAVTGHLPVYNNIPVACSVDLGGKFVIVSNVQTSTLVLTVQVRFRKTSP